MLPYAAEHKGSGAEFLFISCPGSATFRAGGRLYDVDRAYDSGILL